MTCSTCQGASTATQESGFCQTCFILEIALTVGLLLGMIFLFWLFGG